MGFDQAIPHVTPPYLTVPMSSGLQLESHTNRDTESKQRHFLQLMKYDIAQQPALFVCLTPCLDTYEYNFGSLENVTESQIHVYEIGEE